MGITQPFIKKCPLMNNREESSYAALATLLRANTLVLEHSANLFVYCTVSGISGLFFLAWPKQDRTWAWGPCIQRSGPHWAKPASLA